MKIILTCDNGTVIGGAEKVAITSAAGLHDRGVEIEVFTGGDRLDPLLTDRGISGECLNLPLYWNSFFARSKVDKLKTLFEEPRVYDRFRAFLAKQPKSGTIVHVHSFQNRLGQGVFRAALDAGFSTLLTFHDYGFACPTGIFFNYVEGKSCHLKALSGACFGTQCIAPNANQLKKLRYLRQVGQRKLAGIPNRLKHYVAVSDFCAEMMRPYVGSGGQIHIVANPHDVVKSDPAPVATNEALVFVGRLTVEKDPVIVAAAAARLGMPAIIVGEGTLADAVREANPKAEMRGWQGPEGVKQAYRDARAFVMSTRCFESSGMVVSEAMAQGVPVIVTDAGASKEYVTHGVDGYHYRAGDLDSLVEQAAKVKDGAHAANLGQAAYDKFWARPTDLNAHLDGIMAVYEKLLA